MTRVPSLVPGLPDEVYDHDGQLTKREVRAVTLAHLAPAPGELLWDVGAGAGSVAIEWMRAHPRNRAVAIEHDGERAARIKSNAATLGVPDLQVVNSPAPGALPALDRPHAVFVGGGLTAPGLLDTCWDALPPGGRLVTNTVTLEGERIVLAACERFGGTLTRIAVDRAAPIGPYTAWRPQLAITQLSAIR